MKINILIALLTVALGFPGAVCPLEITSPPSVPSFTSILFKQYRVNEYMAGADDGQIQEVKIVLRTNPHETDRRFDHLKFHKLFLSALQSRKHGWHVLFLPTSLRHQITADGWDPVNLQDGLVGYIPVYPATGDDAWLSTIVDYDLGLEVDIDLNFPARNKLTILTSLSVLGDSPLWNTMKYRGEPMEEYVEKVLDKFGEKLKEKYNLLDISNN